MIVGLGGSRVLLASVILPPSGLGQHRLIRWRLRLSRAVGMTDSDRGGECRRVVEHHVVMGVQEHGERAVRDLVVQRSGDVLIEVGIALAPQMMRTGIVSDASLGTRAASPVTAANMLLVSERRGPSVLGCARNCRLNSGMNLWATARLAKKGRLLPAEQIFQQSWIGEQPFHQAVEPVRGPGGQAVRGGPCSATARVRGSRRAWRSGAWDWGVEAV